MKLKANHNLTLPDGKTTVKAGEVFEYKGDISGFKKVVTVLPENDAGKEKNAPAGNSNVSKSMTEEQIRARGKELNIPNYYNKGIEKLEKEIAEAEKKLNEAKLAAEAARAAAGGTEQNTPENDAGKEVETSNAGDENV